MTRCRRPFLAAPTVGLVLTACSGAPPQRAPMPAPAIPQAVLPAPPPAAAPDPRGQPHMIRLDNGLVASITEAVPGSEAQLQLGFLVGSSHMAPGIAELAAETMIQGADASQGRSSLAHAVAELGGFVRVEVGTQTTWISIRVPGARWQAAQAALLKALQVPAQPRSQIERIREQVVQARSAVILADPTTAMARAMLLAETGTAAYVAGLLDRDPSEVGLFQARYFRPDRSIYALHVPGDPRETAAALAKKAPGSLTQWTAQAIAALPPTVLPRDVPTGLHWSPDRARGLCRASLVLFLTELQHPLAAELMMLQACLTLDGMGGRLEQLQRERGLSHVRWTGEYVHGAERTALVLSTDVTAVDAAKLWQTFVLARASLRDVPPSLSEIELANRRARLTAGLGQWSNLARQRVRTLLGVRGDNPGSLADLATLDLARTDSRNDLHFDAAFAELARPGSADFDSALAAFLQMPAAFVVVGGEIPPDTNDVRRFDILPPGFQPPQQPDTGVTTVTRVPWLDHAAAAIGGSALLRRFVGCEAEGRLQTEAAPAAKETLSWRTDGTVRRTRDLLGSQIETRLEAAVWTERLGSDTQVLGLQQAALLRRELERHPIALLAAHARGAIRFQIIAQRTVGDRDLMIVQAEGDRFDRLRVHIDTGSHLIRVVEVWESMPDGTTVHLHDAWSDYRSVAGMRVPFRRITTQDEGQNRVETVFTKWQPVLQAP